jgi:CubicO group peptidase (beta-lactamase class C family)
MFVSFLTLALPTGALARECPDPAGSEPFEQVAPEEVDLDPGAVRDAIGFATTRNAYSVRVYRHGCLAGASVLDPLTETMPNDVWSTTKAVVSLLTGRAATLGLLHIDDPIGDFLPRFRGVDAEHRAITIRQLLTETSGLRFNWTPELAGMPADTVRYTLALPFDHEPGTYNEYAQYTLTLLAYVVERAVGEDLQAFAQRELFGPLGIARRAWFWERERAGHTAGWAHLHMAPLHLARIGALMLNEGVWRGQRLLDAAWLEEAHTPTEPNPAYGFALWTNSGDGAVTPSIPSRKVIEGPRSLVKSAPADMYLSIGFQDQLIMVIPSLDMVIVRTGTYGNHSRDGQTMITANTGDWLHEFFRILMRGVRDAHVPDPGPLPDREPTPLTIGYFVDTHALAGSVGLGRQAPEGCNALGCDQRIAVEGLLQTGVDAAAAAVWGVTGG